MLQIRLLGWSIWPPQVSLLQQSLKQQPWILISWLFTIYHIPEPGSSGGMCCSLSHDTVIYCLISYSSAAHIVAERSEQCRGVCVTGERPEWQLREVMKPANRSFRSKLRNFAQYEQMVKQKRAQQRAAAAAAAAQAEAAAVKAALLAADADSSTSSDIENSSSSSSSVTQQ